MSEPIIEIDARSGFCHGVVTAIRKQRKNYPAAGNHYIAWVILFTTETRWRGLKKRG